MKAQLLRFLCRWNTNTEEGNSYEKEDNIGCSCCGVSVFFLCCIIYQTNGMAADYEDEIEYVIGVSQANMREAWRLALINEIEEEAAKYKNIRIITADATSTVKSRSRMWISF